MKFKITKEIPTETGRLKIGEPCKFVDTEGYVFLGKLYNKDTKRTTYLLLDSLGTPFEIITGKEIKKDLCAD